MSEQRSLELMLITEEDHFAALREAHTGAVLAWCDIIDRAIDLATLQAHARKVAEGTRRHEQRRREQLEA